MSSESIPNIGLKVDMQGYTKMRAFIGGADYWHTSYQSILKDLFSPFFPNMDYNAEDDTVVAGLIENGRELISKTSPIINGDNKGRKIPQHLVEQFKQTILKVRSQMEDPRINPNTLEILRNFSFPSPTVAPELYRIMGYGKKTRLFIIWGMEISPETSVRLTDIDPDTFFPQFLIGPSVDVKKTGIAALILLALTGLCFMTCSSDEDEAADISTPTASVTEPNSITGTWDDVFKGDKIPGGTLISTKQFPAKSFNPETRELVLLNGEKYTMEGERKDAEGEPNDRHFIYETARNEKGIIYRYEITVEDQAPQTGKVDVTNGTLTITTSEGHVRTLKTQDNAPIENLRPGQPLQTSKKTIFVSKKTRKRVILNKDNQLVYEGTNEPLTLTEGGQLIGNAPEDVAEEMTIEEWKEELTSTTTTTVENGIATIKTGDNVLKPDKGAQVKETQVGEMVTTTNDTRFVIKDSTEYVVRREDGTYGLPGSDEPVFVNQGGKFTSETYEIEEITKDVYEKRKKQLASQQTPTPVLGGGEYPPQEVKAGQLYTLIHQQESGKECYITIIPADGVSFKSIKVNGTDVDANEQEKITYDLLGYITVKVTVKQDDAEIEQTATYKLKEKKKSPQKN